MPFLVCVYVIAAESLFDKFLFVVQVLEKIVNRDLFKKIQQDRSTADFDP